MTRCIYLVVGLLLVACSTSHQSTVLNKTYKEKCDYARDLIDMSLRYHPAWTQDDVPTLMARTNETLSQVFSIEPQSSSDACDIYTHYQTQRSSKTETEFQRIFTDAYLRSLDPYSRYLSPERMKEDEALIKNEATSSGVEYYYRHPAVVKAVGTTPLWIDYVHRGSAYPSLHQGMRIDSLEGQTIETADLVELWQKVSQKNYYTIRSSNQTFTIDKQLDVFPDFYIKRLQYDGVQYAWLRIERFTQGLTEKILEALNNQMDYSVMVIDLRGNGGGLISEVMDLLDVFLPNDHIMTEFNAIHQWHKDFHLTQPTQIEKPLIVLIDSNSASASEIFAGVVSMKGRAVLMGNYSYGKMTLQHPHPVGPNNPMGGKIYLTHSMLRFSDQSTAQWYRLIPDVWLKDPQIDRVEEKNMRIYEKDHPFSLKPGEAKPRPAKHDESPEWTLPPCEVQSLRDCVHDRVGEYIQTLLTS